MAKMNSDFTPLVDTIGFVFKDARTWDQVEVKPVPKPAAPKSGMVLLDFATKSHLQVKDIKGEVICQDGKFIPRVAHSVPNLRTTITQAPNQDGFLIGGTRL